MSTSAWQQSGGPSGAPVGTVAPSYAPQSGPAPWTAPTHPGPKTNALAVWAIVAAASGATVLLGIGSIVGIVLGAIALAQIRRTGDDGRVLAVWAIILGIVTIVALFATAVLFSVMIVAVAEQLAPLTEL